MKRCELNIDKWGRCCVALSIILAGPILALSAARGETCQINGRDIYFSGVNCLPNLGCASINQKISVIGDKVLLYQDVNLPQGDAFILGQEINPDAGGLNQPYQFQTPNQFPGSHEVASAIASFDGNVLFLRQHRQLLLSTGETFSNYNFDVTVTFRGCANCQIQFRQWGNVGQRIVSSQFTPTSCVVSGV